MKLTKRRFKAIERLIHQLHDEIISNAQGDNGHDIERREEKYRKRLEKMMSTPTRAAR